ncbi:MAG: FliM/FliN family flagellar motor C-terminal domain-containing protein [Planctomycetota bacterium]
MGRTIESILRLEVPIIVRVGERRMTLADASSLSPGSIIELNKNADEQLDLLANNIPIAQGSAVKVGENFGIGIEYVGDLKERIEALGGQQPSSSFGGDDEPGFTDADAEALAEQFLNG